MKVFNLSAEGVFLF